MSCHRREEKFVKRKEGMLAAMCWVCVGGWVSVTVRQGWVFSLVGRWGGVASLP